MREIAEESRRRRRNILYDDMRKDNKRRYLERLATESNIQSDERKKVLQQGKSEDMVQENKKKLVGEELLIKYREVISSGGTLIKASIECGWDYKTQMGWFKQAVARATEEETSMKYKEEQIICKSMIFTVTKPNSCLEVNNNNLLKVRKLSTRQVTVKIRSSTFRKSVLDAHGTNCACCKINVVELIEAAHIRPVEDGGEDQYQNGIPFCPTHHTAFDRFLFTIDPLDRKVIFARGFSSDVLGIISAEINLNLSFDNLLYRRLLFESASDSDD